MYIIIALAIVIIISLLVINFIDYNRFVVDKYIFESSKVKEEKTFVFLSDLHSKVYGKENENLINKISELKPDYILVGGDMITAKPGKTTAQIADFVGKLKDIAPLCYALGNHEYRMRLYPEVYGDMYERYVKELALHDIVFLDNSNKEFGDFCIYGLTIDRKYYKRFKTIHMQEDYIESLLGRVDESKFNILLGHNPDYFENYAGYGADLSLSGHIHGGIMRLPFLGGVVSPKIRLFPRYDGGRFDLSNKSLIVSRGLGVHTIPIRINNPGELSYIVIRPKL